MVEVSSFEHRGWEVLRVGSAELGVEVLPGLGGTISSVRLLSDATELLWAAPWGLPARGARPLHSEAAMASSFPGGWQTLFPQVSDATALHGVEFSVESEARTADFTWRSSGSSLILTTRLLRTPLTVTKIISVRGRAVTLGETVKNVGGETVPTTWGSQLVLGPPLVSAATVVETAATLVRPDPRVALDATYEDLLPWPRAYGPDGLTNLRTLAGGQPSLTQLGYLSDFTVARVSVTNPTRQLAVELDWDLGAWPHLAYSAERCRRGGFPWYRAAEFLALTPSSSWPARPAADVRRISGTALLLAPGEARTSHLTLTASGRA